MVQQSHVVTAVKLQEQHEEYENPLLHDRIQLILSSYHGPIQENLMLDQSLTGQTSLASFRANLSEQSQKWHMPTTKSNCQITGLIITTTPLYIIKSKDKDTSIIRTPL